MPAETYQIKTAHFEGPFDLLLFFIERDELDIYDIPISKITDDFLEYLHEMQNLDIELASEFMLVAATLMRIKARLLLPRKELDEEGREIDPRQELVDRLLEYKRYKDLVEDLRKLESGRSEKHTRANLTGEIQEIYLNNSADVELQSLSMYKLMRAFQRVMNRFDERQKAPTHKVKKYPYAISDEKNGLIKRLKKGEKTKFEAIFNLCENRLHCIFTFLAVLELLQQNNITIRVGVGVNNFTITLV